MDGRLSEIDRAEVLRYLGVRGAAPDEDSLALVGKAIAKVAAVAAPRYVRRAFPLSHEGGTLSLGGTQLLLAGRDIASHLSGCAQAVLFAATLGGEVDAAIRRAQVSDMAYAVAVDAAASAAIENVCDNAMADICTEITGCHTARFSPGYGDFPLSVQKAALSILDAGRKIGLHATDDFLLTPAKSVTAVWGVAEYAKPRENGGCRTCGLADNCAFRKEEIDG